MFFVALAAIATSCGRAERSADRLWRQAIDRVAHGDTQGAVNILQTIIDRYPDTIGADKARAQIVVYRGLLSAVQAYPSRRAREVMIALARAIETFRRDNGRVPPSLDVLVPTALASVPIDPWNHPFTYAATDGGYTLSCLGADGSPGGDGDAADLVVVDGAFVREKP